MTLSGKSNWIGSLVLLTLTAAAAAAAQTASSASDIAGDTLQQPPAMRGLPLEHQGATLNSGSPQVTSSVQPLLDFKEADIKFSLQAMMNTLRDNRHEGWVLAAYPDPKTSRPLIGAGFSLDVPARQHVQRDPLNAQMFLEPSSAELWEAAGLEPQRLQAMLEQYDRDLAAWNKKKFRKKIRMHELFPSISEEDAVKLLRISAIQAILNAKAYCRNFDKLSGSQQMAISQLVFQMGVNLEQFTQFLWAINNRSAYPYVTQGAGVQTVAEANDPQLVAAVMTEASDDEYWNAVQGTLIHSDWARRYSTRAIAVIAMFDPDYETAPREAEARVRVQVHPLHHRKRPKTSVRTASAPHKKAAARHAQKS